VVVYYKDSPEAMKSATARDERSGIYLRRGGKEDTEAAEDSEELGRSIQ
jgi:hypothetical protein